MAAATESKVFGGTIGAGSGAIVTTFVLWVLGVYAWGAGGSSDAAQEAVAAVPGPVSAFLGLVLTAGGAFAGGWLAKHTPRLEEYVPKRALVDDGAGSESPTVDSDESVDSDQEIVPEYSTV